MPRFPNPVGVYAKALDAPGLGPYDPADVPPRSSQFLREQVDLCAGMADSTEIKTTLGEVRALLDEIERLEAACTKAAY
jgi:hypothetical protein